MQQSNELIISNNADKKASSLDLLDKSTCPLDFCFATLMKEKTNVDILEDLIKSFVKIEKVRPKMKLKELNIACNSVVTCDDTKRKINCDFADYKIDLWRLHLLLKNGVNPNRSGGNRGTIIEQIVKGILTSPKPDNKKLFPAKLADFHTGIRMCLHFGADPRQVTAQKSGPYFMYLFGPKKSKRRNVDVRQKFRVSAFGEYSMVLLASQEGPYAHMPRDVVAHLLTYLYIPMKIGQHLVKLVADFPRHPYAAPATKLLATQKRKRETEKNAPNKK
jgi:hypothetical protein